MEIVILERKFPNPLAPPLDRDEVRRVRYKELLRSSFKGISVRIFIAIFELVTSLLFGSAVLFMDALSTGLDIVTSLALIISFKLAAKPPDSNHPFGHGRFEPLAGFQLGIFLAVLGVGMFFFNTSEISRHDPNTAIHSMLWVIPLTSVILLEVCYRLLMRAAIQQKSPALAADAVHYRIDSLTSLFATLALIAVSFAPRFNQIIDHIGAAIIALFMVIIGIKAAWNNMHQILDRIPSNDYLDRVRKAAIKVVGVKGTEKIRMQLYGPDAYVGIDVEVDPELTVQFAHEISQKVRFEIQKELPQVIDVMVHIEPYYLGDH